MFLESIRILDTDICVQEPGKFIAHTRASTNLAEVMPYLNTILRFADYNANAHSIKFKHQRIEYTLLRDEINVAKFVNRTELHELLDWVQELINDTYDSREEIPPTYESRQPPPVLSILKLLPRTNCKQCGEASCMAFAAKLNKLEAEPEECLPLAETQYRLARSKLEQVFA